MTQPMNATPNSASAESLPSAASAPAMTSVGIAGSGRPICSSSTFANTSASPCCVISRTICCMVRPLDGRKQKLHYGTTPFGRSFREKADQDRQSPRAQRPLLAGDIHGSQGQAGLKGAVEVTKMVSPDYLIEINAIAVVQP